MKLTITLELDLVQLSHLLSLLPRLELWDVLALVLKWFG